MPLGDKVELVELARTTYGFVGADLAALTREAAIEAVRRIMPKLNLEERTIPAEVLDEAGRVRVLGGDANQVVAGPPPPGAPFDLVFIDPVSTGFSRPVPGESANQFHGLQEDIASVGDFIRAYITRNERWLSPKIVVGESYGTTRAVAGFSASSSFSSGCGMNQRRCSFSPICVQ